MRIILTSLAVIALAAAAIMPAAAAPKAQTIRVTETDFRIVLSAKPKPGKVTFVIRNVGRKDHDFHLRGRGLVKRTPMLAPGRSARLTVTLKRGVRYQILCAPHAGKGMRASFVVR